MMSNYLGRLNEATPHHVKVGGWPPNYRHCIPEGWRPQAPRHIWAVTFDPIGETMREYGCADHLAYGRIGSRYVLHFYSPYKAAIIGDPAEYLKIRFNVVLLKHPDELYSSGAITLCVCHPDFAESMEGWELV